MTIKRKYLAISIVFIILCANQAAAKQAPPTDTCLAIDGYYEFRAKLERIVERRDTKALIALAHPEISSDFFGGDSSIATFKRNFNLDAGKKSYIWDEMDQILRLGCDGFEGQIAFPYMDKYAIDAKDTDGYSKGAKDGSMGHGVIIGNTITMRDRPEENAAIIATLHWDIYDFEAYTEQRDWAQISLDDGKKGWVRSSVLRDFANTRMGFERIDGVWRMTYILAGN